MIIKCKMCGGDIQFNPGDTNGQCDHCGCTTTFPKLPDEQRANLFNRANHFRRQCEFDKAMAAYEHILEEDDTDAEAHWGIVLSKFGIEYVEDPVTHERIPTCHRAQVISILSDEDYQNALKYAPDTYSREIYEKEAKRIAEIQKGILAISSQEKPYDVFICYKETDDSGSRTKDSTLAQEIYYQLTNEGYKVFFSRITLEDKLGQEYEPYIFAALNSAKVMLVVGTRPEFFNAVWVKNEWNRYLALMKNDRKRVLIPCYRDMDPYDLPEELSSLQSQDMGKIGFMQDIIHGVKKVLGSDKQTAPNVTVQAAGPGIASLHKRAVLFLEDNDWDSATEYFDRILDIDPEYAPAYIGKVQVKNKVRREADLARCREPISSDPDFQKAVRFADEKQKAIYNGYNRAIIDRIELERKEAAYREAVALENRAAVEADFLAAAKKYDSAGEIRDAKDRAANCRAKASSAKAEAEKAAAVYKAQMERERKERARQEEERRLAEEKRRAEEAERQRKEEELRKENRKRATKIGALVAAIVLLLAGGYYLFENVIHPGIKYNQAQSLLNDGKYDEAYTAFEAMGDYGDSSNKLLEINYRRAESYLAEKDFANARKYFALAGAYSDANQQIQNIDNYIAAQTDYENGDLISAGAKYKNLGSFSDAAAQLESISSTLYTQTKAALESKNYKDAFDLLTILGDYSDCPTLMAGIDENYNLALQHWNDGEKFQAEQELQALIGWREASDKLSALRLEIADNAYTNGDYEQALSYYGMFQETDEIKAKITAAQRGQNYLEAEAALESGDLETAYTKFIAAGNHADASDQATKLVQYEQAKNLVSEGKYKEAREIYTSLGNYLDAPEKITSCDESIYAEAKAALENGNISDAYDSFTLISGYSDSAEIVSKIENDYQAALDHIEKQEWFEAESILLNLRGWSDVDSTLELLWRKIGDNALTKKNYDQAIAYYNKLPARSEDIEAKLTTAIQGKNYTEGLSALASGKLDNALEKFTAAGEFEDSAAQAAQITAYQQAGSYLSEEKYQEARAIYLQLGDYLQSAEKLESCNATIYGEATELKANGDYAKANELFVLISGYADSTDIASQFKTDYQAAADLLKEGSYDDAYVAFTALKNYSDSPTKAKESMYQKAESLKEAGSIDDAVVIYSGLGDYKDSAEKISICLYDKAETQVADGKTDEAIATFESISNYSDSSERAKSLRYNKAKALRSNGELQAARQEYEVLGDYSDSADLLVQVLTEIADKAMDEKDYATALSAYQGLEQTDYIKEREYMLAQLCYDEGHFAEATSAYENLGQYELSLSKLPIARYAWADQLFNNGEYEKAAEQFTLLGDMTDSATRANESIYQLSSEKLTAKSYDEAKVFFSNIADYKDASTLAKECDYRKATDLLAEGKDKEAETLFKSLGEYSDSKTKAEECIYNQAETLFNAKKYAEAKPLYDTITFSDSQTKSKQCIYNQAEILFAAGKYAEAKPLYDSIDYSDSQTKSKQCVYNQAEALFAAKKYNDASKMYASIDYLDSKDKAKLSTYQEAETYYSGNQFAEAEAIFLSLNDYSDSANRAKDCHLQQGIVLMDAGDYRGALEFYETVEYDNSADLAAKCHYELGRISHLAGKTDEAVAEYAYAVSLSEACSALLSAAKDYSVINEPEKAIQTLWLIRNQEDAQNELSKVASAAIQNEKIDLALLAYSVFEEHPEIDFVDLYQNTSYDSITVKTDNCSLLAEDLEFKEYTMYHFATMARDYGLYDVAAQAYSDLGEYSDSANKVLETKYDQGKAKRAVADWDGAVKAFTEAGTYSDAETQINETRYQEASAKEKDGDQQGAYDIFISLGEYSDSFIRANKPYYDLGITKQAAGEWDAAVAAFEHAGTYSDAATQILATRYAEGKAKRSVADWEGAIKAFTEAGTYSDSATQAKDIQYQQAKQLLEEKQYQRAYDLFKNIQGYKDVDTLINDPSFAIIIKVDDIRKQIDNGGNLIFGEYEQDNNVANGKEGIEWIVLEKSDNKVLLLSKMGLDAVPFNNKSPNRKDRFVTWETCSLRSWLNNDFIKLAFEDIEQKMISTVLIDNSIKQAASGSNDTYDKIFLLSYHEVHDIYFSDVDKPILCSPTAYAISRSTNEYGSVKEESTWWLRSPGYNYQTASVANRSRSVETRSSFMTSRHVCVRPALWLDLSIINSEVAP